MVAHRIQVSPSPRGAPSTFLVPSLSFSSSPATSASTSSSTTYSSLKASFVQKLLSVRVLLLTSFTLQVVIISVIMYNVVIYSQTQITNDLSERMIQQVIGRVFSITKASFATTYLAVRGIRYELPSGNATLEELRLTTWKLWQYSGDQFQDIYWGNLQGDVMGYYTPPSRDTLYIFYSDKSHYGGLDGYLIPVTDTVGGTGDINNADTIVLANYSVADYVWYPVAFASRTGEPTWSQVYKDPSFPEALWVTCSIPLWDPVTNVTYGVVNIDITSENLNKELQMISVSPHAQIWIMEHDGSLVASSDSSEHSYTDHHANGVNKAQESNLELVRETTRVVFARNDNRTDYQFSYELHGKTINAYYHAISDYGLQLALLVAYPQNDFFAVVQRAKTIIIIVCFSVLVVSVIVGVLVMCLITKPLTRLGQQMDYISKGVFEIPAGSASVRSSTKLYEIYTLQEDFHRMVTALKSFGRFVPVDIVRYLLRNNTEATVSMSQKDLTVMFSDIKNFTRKVEEMTPNQLSSMLSDYLNTMCSAITETNGTVDKFIGDAIMALWNVPTLVENHAVQACQTALLSIISLEQLNKKWIAIDLPDVGVRIGIHTGKALVGNLGSNERLAFTAVGDNINLAARLESLNKQYGTSILLSGEVYEQVKEQFLCRYLDVVVVVGRTTHTHIYELITRISEATEGLRTFCDLQARALTCFLERNFEDAIQIYSRLAVEMPDDISIKLLLERSKVTQQQYKESGLPPDWTGYLILSDK